MSNRTLTGWLFCRVHSWWTFCLSLIQIADGHSIVCDSGLICDGHWCWYLHCVIVNSLPYATFPALLLRIADYLRDLCHYRLICSTTGRVFLFSTDRVHRLSNWNSALFQLSTKIDICIVGTATSTWWVYIAVVIDRHCSAKRYEHLMPCDLYIECWCRTQMLHFMINACWPQVDRSLLLHWWCTNF